ncbi:MAG: regulatory protein RecX [Acidobacteriota bacterium]
MAGKRQDIFYQAQDILSRRDHAEAEVRQKLRRKGFGGRDIEQAIHWLKQKHLLNDADFAQRYVENVLQIKAVGPRWLLFKLRQKGVNSHLAEEAVRTAMSSTDEGRLVEAAAITWKRQHGSRSHDRQRLARFLLARGFSSEMVRAYVEQEGS